MLQIEKTNLNTDDVVLHLAKTAGIRKLDVGYAGLKDKQAVTTQWFSLYLPGKPMPDWDQFKQDGLKIIRISKNERKLKTGAITSNRFQIILNNVNADKSGFEQGIAAIKATGVPNYFGEQRFGHAEQNLFRARDMLQGKKVKSRYLRGVYYSALRSFLFNHVLSHRVKTHTWNVGLDGEAMALNGSRAFFVAEKMDAELARRIRDFDIHPSGPLPGKESGELVCADAQRLEQQLLQPYADLCSGLVKSGLLAQRRSLRLPVADLEFDWLGDDRIQLDFSLPSGTYATSVLRELVSVDS